MSGLELAALGALTAGYLDSRWQFVKDLNSIRLYGGGMITNALNKRSGKVNLFYVFQNYAQTQPDKLFLVYPEPIKGKTIKVTNGEPSEPFDNFFNVKRYTYKQAYDIVLKYSDVFYNQLGVRPRDVVSMDYVNKDEFVFIWMALWNLGAIPAFLNYNLQGKALTHCVITAQSKFFLVDEEVQANVKEIEHELTSKNIQIHYVNDAFRSRVSDAKGFVLPDKERPIPEYHDPSCYIFTSGTTGLPKAANLSWKKANITRLYSRVIRLKNDDIMYSAMPLYHSTAACLGLLGTLTQGGAFAVGHRFSTTTFWTQVRITNATVIQYVGETCRYLLNAPSIPDEREHSVRMAIGNGLRPDVWTRFKERFNIETVDEFYGATEFPTVITNQQKGEFGIGACTSFGSLISTYMLNMRYRLAALDPDTQEIWRDPQTGFARTTLPDEPGELLFNVAANDVKSDFQGYVGNTKATNEKVIFDVFTKGDAYVRSGDLLRLNKEQCLFFVDRLGDTFRWKSENVSTNEVEEAITEFSGVQQAVVVGIKVPNHEGRAGFAVIQPNESKTIDFAALGQHLVKRLPRYAVPIFLKISHSIETTGNNKVQKNQFRDQKIPSEKEEIYWLVGDRYELLTQDTWKLVETGHTKL